jgi:hypothetical protein
MVEKNDNIRRQYELEALRAHRAHITWIYGLRIVGLGIGAFAVIVGAAMLFAGLQGSFNWAVEIPHSIEAKLTNASPGIVFVTAGPLIVLWIGGQAPVDFLTPKASIQFRQAPNDKWKLLFIMAIAGGLLGFILARWL